MKFCCRLNDIQTALQADSDTSEESIPFLYGGISIAVIRPQSMIKSIVNLKNLHKCLIYADFTLLVYRYAGEAVCLPYPLRPRRELLALSFGFLSAALPLIRGELRTLPLPPLAATCRCSHLQQRGSPFSASQSRVLALRIVNC